MPGPVHPLLKTVAVAVLAVAGWVLFVAYMVLWALWPAVAFWATTHAIVFFAGLSWRDWRDSQRIEPERVEPPLVPPMYDGANDPAFTGHDDRCESEWLNPPGAYTSCGCGYRRDDAVGALRGEQS